VQEEIADEDLLGDDTTRKGERWGEPGDLLGDLEPVAAAKGERPGEPSGAAASGAAASGAAASGGE